MHVFTQEMGICSKEINICSKEMSICFKEMPIVSKEMHILSWFMPKSTTKFALFLLHRIRASDTNAVFPHAFVI
jgi:hypothetical protein